MKDFFKVYGIKIIYVFLAVVPMLLILHVGLKNSNAREQMWDKIKSNPEYHLTYNVCFHSYDSTYRVMAIHKKCLDKMNRIEEFKNHTEAFN